MSIEGLIVGITPDLRCSPLWIVRCRMSLRLVAITSLPMLSPMRRAMSLACLMSLAAPVV